MGKARPSPQPITGKPFRDDDPLFTVIVTNYEASVSGDDFRRSPLRSGGGCCGACCGLRAWPARLSVISWPSVRRTAWLGERDLRRTKDRVRPVLDRERSNVRPDGIRLAQARRRLARGNSLDNPGGALVGCRAGLVGRLADGYDSHPDPVRSCRACGSGRRGASYCATRAERKTVTCDCDWRIADSGG